ncbi:hypothetical protein [Nocardia sp. NPDC127526]|uniref:hypothetical protein n=1 Tax=Nocardia sp. NPDC127526 TaxID=3345393 RepID=UPI00363A71E5
MSIPGARCVTLVDSASGLAIAAAGQHDLADQHEDAAASTEAVRAVIGCPALTSGGGGDDITEIIVGGTRGYHLLNLVNGDFDGRLFVHVRFDDESGNLGLARFRLRSVLSEFVGAEYGHGTEDGHAQ